MSVDLSRAGRSPACVGRVLSAQEDSGMWFIQGFFFQEVAGIGPKLNLNPLRTGGVTIAPVQKVLVPIMYAGTIQHVDGDKTKPLVGGVNDALGKAELSYIFISEQEVRFTKRYVRRDKDIAPQGYIHYTLRPGGKNTWVGEYTAPGILPSSTRCIITEVDEDLFIHDGTLAIKNESEGARTAPSS